MRTIASDEQLTQFRNDLDDAARVIAELKDKERRTDQFVRQLQADVATKIATALEQERAACISLLRAQLLREKETPAKLALAEAIGAIDDRRAKPIEVPRTTVGTGEGANGWNPEGGR